MTLALLSVLAGFAAGWIACALKRRYVDTPTTSKPLGGGGHGTE